MRKLLISVNNEDDTGTIDDIVAALTTAIDDESVIVSNQYAIL